ncbi:LysR substrate-binding domain-containing protein [Pseudooceanicola algae]|uniref:Octopine catabolism/uptake operon regulatory protein OccR n=1 Tax=Pseudooceanicola algae TaxID=1537215 RepID=A0A418SEC1_9RHOB|nr:LysR substrate-binding domain-containing protein [Pseudooceanicola algae]QPM89706.1 Octopine catabolism/uptake operon regulatory protein OccR [Pseudooceanicola algae]
MNPKQLTAFRMVMQHGTITEASRALSVSQPAVSRLIADLEADIGFPLLHRPGGKAIPTREAYEFYQEVERMFYGLDRLSQVAEEIRMLNRAVCRVASMPMVSFEILPRALKQIVDGHSGIDVNHDVHTSARILDLLASRQIDIGIAQTDPGRGDVEILAAYRTNCVCVMSPDHPLRTRAAITPEDLQGEPMVALNFRTLTYSYLMRCFAEAGIAPKIVAETQPSYSACSLAALGVGIAVVDPITPGILGDRVQVVPFTPKIPFDYQIIKPAGMPMSRAATAFFDSVQKIIASEDRFGQQLHNKIA